MIDRPLLLCLLALIGVATYLRDRRMAGAAIILFVNWIACSAYVAQTTPEVPTWFTKYPWPVFGAFDYAAGYSVLVMLRRYGTVTLWQVAIGLIYVAELICHASVGAKVIANVDPEWVLYQGFQFLGPAAWAQVAVMGAWAGHELAGRIRMPLRGVSDRLAGLGCHHQSNQNAQRAKGGMRK